MLREIFVDDGIDGKYLPNLQFEGFFYKIVCLFYQYICQLLSKNFLGSTASKADRNKSILER